MISAVVISRDDGARILPAVRSVVEQRCEEPFEVIVVTSGTGGAAALVRREFPNVTIVKIPFDNENLTNYFKGRGEPVDALFFTAERGSFRTLLYPAFSVAVPQPVVLKLPLAYPVARRDVEFARFLGLSIDLKKKDGTIQGSTTTGYSGVMRRSPNHTGRFCATSCTGSIDAGK